MNKDGGRVTLISLSVVCFILLYSTVAFYVMVEGEKAKRHVLQKKFDEVTIAKQDLESKLKESEALTVELRTRLKTQEETITLATQRLDEMTGTNNRNLFKLQARENEIRSMRARISGAVAEKDVLTARLAKASEDYINLRSQIENSSKTKEEIDRKAKETAEREGVSLGTIAMNQKKNR